METLAWQASAFWFTWNRQEAVSFTVAHTLSGSAAFVSLSSRMTLTCAHAPYRSLGLLALREGAAQPRRPVGLARRCLGGDCAVEGL